jgi:hypothetical protein
MSVVGLGVGVPVTSDHHHHSAGGMSSGAAVQCGISKRRARAAHSDSQIKNRNK